MPFPGYYIILLVNLTVHLLATPIIPVEPRLRSLPHESHAPRSRPLGPRAVALGPISDPPTQSSSGSTALQPGSLYSPSSITNPLIEVTSRSLESRVVHSNSPSHHLQKRVRARPLNVCPLGDVFTASRCQRYDGLQAYVIHCWHNTAHVATPTMIRGSCTPGEICVPGRLVPNPSEPGLMADMAYCVSMENFVKIAETQIAKMERKFVYTPWWDRPAYKGSGGHVLAILGDLEGRRSVVADSISMMAQNDIPMRDGPLINPLAGGPMKGASECRNCAELRLDGVPEGTAK
ncbi:MAG: hypothetical protein Q9187_003092, partial [Circinaria calcarea]